MESSIQQLELDASNALSGALAAVESINELQDAAAAAAAAQQAATCLDNTRRFTTRLGFLLQGGDSELGALDPGSLRAHLQELHSLRARCADCESVLRSVRQHILPRNERAALFAHDSIAPRRSPLEHATMASATSMLRRTRTAMQEELRRIGSVTSGLQRDSETLASAAEQQSAYAGDAAEAQSRVRAYKQKQARERWIVLAAFAVLVVTASYVSARRILWTFTGLRLP